MTITTLVAITQIETVQACRCAPACVVELERTCRHKKVSHSVTDTRAPESTESESANLAKIAVSADTAGRIRETTGQLKYS